MTETKIREMWQRGPSCRSVGGECIANDYLTSLFFLAFLVSSKSRLKTDCSSFDNLAFMEEVYTLNSIVHL